MYGRESANGDFLCTKLENAEKKIRQKYFLVTMKKQGKSEGFESCDRPIVRKRPIWVKISDVLYRVTLKFDGWP